MSPASNTLINTAGRNALVTSLMVCCGFIICWTPVEILTILNFIGSSVELSSWLYNLSVLLIANSCINPFIYAAKYHEFQQAVRRLKSKLSQHQSQVSASA